MMCLFVFIAWRICYGEWNKGSILLGLFYDLLAIGIGYILRKYGILDKFSNKSHAEDDIDTSTWD